MIAGLNSWGDGSLGVGVGEYGAWDYQTRVSQYIAWIQSETTGTETSGGEGGQDSGGVPIGDAPKEGCSSTATRPSGLLGLLFLAGALCRRERPGN